MHPILFEIGPIFGIGPIPIHTYGFLIAIGFLISLALMRLDAKKVGIDPDFVSDTALWVLFLGLSGTRIAHIIMFPQEYSWSDPIGWIAVWRGGLVFQGALPPAIAYCLYTLHKHKIRTWLFADVVSPYIPLGHAFGRMGCFMYGCCYGCQTSVPWGIQFPRFPADLAQPPTGSPVFIDQRLSLPSDALWSYPVHPTQLYEGLGLLLCCGLLLLARRYWRPFTGCTFALYLIFYGVLRFIVEFFRADHNPTTFGYITDQQVFCILMALAGLILGAILWLRGGKNKASNI